MEPTTSPTATTEAAFDTAVRVMGGEVAEPYRVFSPEFGEIVAALAKAQAAYGVVAKDHANQQFGNSRYADRADIIEGVRPHLAANGIAVVQSIIPSQEGTVTVETYLMHSSGQWIRGICSLPVSPQIQNEYDANGKKTGRKFKIYNSHAFGSAYEYACRYGLRALVSIAIRDAEDDDGNQASGSRVARTAQESRQQSSRQSSAPPKKEWSPTQKQTRFVWAIACERAEKALLESGAEDLKEPEVTRLATQVVETCSTEVSGQPNARAIKTQEEFNKLIAAVQNWGNE